MGVSSILRRVRSVVPAVGLVVLLAGCASDPAVAGGGSADGPAVRASTTEAAQTIGAVELVRLVNEGLALPARIDTGATTCSLDARDIKNVERDGKPWVRFQVVDRKTGKQIEVTRPVVRTTTIKRHGAPDSVRPVVLMEIVLGDHHTKVEFTLTDREKFEFPVLVGRNLLDGRFVVDVSLENSAPPIQPER